MAFERIKAGDEQYGPDEQVKDHDFHDRWPLGSNQLRQQTGNVPNDINNVPKDIKLTIVSNTTK